MAWHLMVPGHQQAQWWLNGVMAVRFPDFPGNALADPCPPGSYCPEGTDEPIACPEGTYSPAYGLMTVAECLNCTGGYFCNETGRKNNGLVPQYIKTETKWLPFCRQHFQINFLECIFVVFWFKFYWNILHGVWLIIGQHIGLNNGVALNRPQ